jgi:TolB-like protein/Flp pilus assembly protein TadD
VDGATLVRDSVGPHDEATELSEIETSILPHTTDSNIARSTGPTTSLPGSLASDTTRKLPRPKRKLVAIAAGVLIAVCASVAGYWLFARKTSATIESIAVMPFTNDSGNTEGDYLSDGMTETLINSLSNIPNLSVKARSSVFRYKGQQFDPKKIASELNVQAILTGRVIERDDQLSLSLELIDAATENVIWGNKYERKASELVALQSDVARDVSNKLKSRMPGADDAKVAKSHTANPEAYQLYLKGLFYWNKRTPEALKKSVEYFNMALDKDPNYAPAYAGVASGYVLYPEYSIYAPREVVPKAKTMARRALELDDNLAEAHTAFGYALLTYDRNFEEANKHFKRAMELNPNYATAYQWYTDGYLVASGRIDEALTYIKKAHDLDPFSLIINTQMGLCYVYARDYDTAHEQFRKTIELDPNWYLGHWFLGLTYELKGNLKDAYAQYQKAKELADDPYILAHIAHVEAALGRREEALKNVEQMKEIAKHRYVPAYAFAIAYTGLGQKDEALNWLERSDEDRAWDILHVKVEPLLDPLRNEERYKKLIERIGF